jgi:hypothetical protein
LAGAAVWAHAAPVINAAPATDAAKASHFRRKRRMGFLPSMRAAPPTP